MLCRWREAFTDNNSSHLIHQSIQLWGQVSVTTDQSAVGILTFRHFDIEAESYCQRGSLDDAGSRCRGSRSVGIFMFLLILHSGKDRDWCRLGNGELTVTTSLRMIRFCLWSIDILYDLQSSSDGWGLGTALIQHLVDPSDKHPEREWTLCTVRSSWERIVRL